MKKKVLFILFLCIIYGLSMQAQDTITIDVGEKAKIIIYTKDAEGLKMVKKMDLNQLIKEVTGDSTNREGQVTNYVYDFNKETNALDMKMEVRGSDTIRRYTYSQESRYHRTRRFRPSLIYDWAVELGFLNYFEKGQTPDGNAVGYGLSNSSRIFSIVNRLEQRIGGQKSPFYLVSGLEVSWYNFIFTDNNYITANNQGVVFNNYVTDFNQALNKSKLTITYLSIPLGFQFYLPNKYDRRAWRFGASGYGGFRIDSYSKTKFDRNPNRQRNSFYLNDWRYGIEANVGYRNYHLFFKYDFNTLFKEDKGPELNAFAIGFKFFE